MYRLRRSTKMQTQKDKIPMRGLWGVHKYVNTKRGNTTARCAIQPNLLFPLLHLMIFNNISKESFEIFKTNPIPKFHHLLQQDIL